MYTTDEKLYTNFGEFYSFHLQSFQLLMVCTKISAKIEKQVIES